MANESRVFRLPAGMSTQVVANAVEAFLSSAKGMEVQSAETTEGYVVQGPSGKRRLEDHCRHEDGYDGADVPFPPK